MVSKVDRVIRLIKIAEDSVSLMSSVCLCE